MAVYDINGNALSQIYGIDGSPLLKAYAVDGTEIFPDEPPEPIQLRVMTYNVGGWYIGSGTNVPSNLDAAFYALQNGMLSTQDADILCIQEYWNNFSSSRTALSLLSPHFQYIHAENGNSQYYGHAICSKYPIKSYTQHIFTGDAQGRYYDEAVITIGAVDVHVFVTHLHPSDVSQKIAQATELFNYVKNLTEPFIICGDFNSTLYDPMSSTNEAIYGQFLNDGCTLANDGAFGILPTACNSADWMSDKFAIDNIICSDGITITDVWTDLTKTTDADVLAAGKIDHIPLIAEVELL
jgi:Metal-dependent hydrolase